MNNKCYYLLLQMGIIISARNTIPPPPIHHSLACFHVQISYEGKWKLVTKATVSSHTFFVRYVCSVYLRHASVVFHHRLKHSAYKQSACLAERKMSSQVHAVWQQKRTPNWRTKQLRLLTIYVFMHWWERNAIAKAAVCYRLHLSTVWMNLLSIWPGHKHRNHRTAYTVSPLIPNFHLYFSTKIFPLRKDSLELTFFFFFATAVQPLTLNISLYISLLYK